MIACRLPKCCQTRSTSSVLRSAIPSHEALLLVVSVLKRYKYLAAIHRCDSADSESESSYAQRITKGVPRSCSLFLFTLFFFSSQKGRDIKFLRAWRVLLSFFLLEITNRHTQRALSTKLTAVQLDSRRKEWAKSILSARTQVQHADEMLPS